MCLIHLSMYQRDPVAGSELFYIHARLGLDELCASQLRLCQHAY